MHPTWLFPQDLWYPVKDGNATAFAIFKRHYSYREYADGRRSDLSNPNRMLFMGPGEKLPLLTPEHDALFGWRKFIDDSGQQGVNCCVFRNEGPKLASDLILAAEPFAARRWPGERAYTTVNPKKVKGTCPGYCFIRAGWRRCGVTKSGLLIFEKMLPVL